MRAYMLRSICRKPARVLLPWAKIGIHSPIGGGYETSNSFAITTVMARTLASLGVPDAIVGRTIRTSPGEMAWLTDAELMGMGAVRLKSDARLQDPINHT